MKIPIGRLLPPLLVLGLTACSTYVGHKLDTDGSLPPAATGIPYTMSKPEYTLNIAPNSEDSSKAVYTLSKVDVPDPNHRYTIALDPALLTDGKFTLKFGDTGNIAEASAVTTSRVVATIKAVGKAAAQFKLYDATEKPELDAYLGYVAGTPACQVAAAPASVTTVAQTISAALSTLRERGESEKEGSGVDRALADFFYTTPAEQGCLKAVRTVLDTTTTQAITDMKNDVSLAKASATWVLKASPSATLTTASLAEIRAIVQSVDDWIKKEDKGALDRAATYASKYRDVAGLDDYITRSRDYVNAIVGFARIKAVARALDLPQDVWRARLVKWLGTEIEHQRFVKDLDPTSAGTRRQNITKLEEKRADLVGGSLLLFRIRHLDDFLTKIPVVRAADGKGERIAADEHIKLREERDRLEAQLNALVASTVSSDTKGADKTKIQARQNVSVRVANKKFVDDVNSNLAVFYDKPPEFVLVLSPRKEVGFTDAPVRKELK